MLHTRKRGRGRYFRTVGRLHRSKAFIRRMATAMSKPLVNLREYEGPLRFGFCAYEMRVVEPKQGGYLPPLVYERMDPSGRHDAQQD